MTEEEKYIKRASDTMWALMYDSINHNKAKETEISMLTVIRQVISDTKAACIKAAQDKIFETSGICGHCFQEKCGHSGYSVLPKKIKADHIVDALKAINQAEVKLKGASDES